VFTTRVLFQQQCLPRSIAPLKELFEAVYGTQVTSYFTEEKAAVSSGGGKKVKAKFGSGAGYSGGYNETNLIWMHRKQEEVIAYDDQFGEMFKQLAKAESKVYTDFGDLNFILAYFLREANISEMIETRSELFVEILKLTAALSGDSTAKAYLLPQNPNGNIVKLIKEKRKAGRVYVKCLKEDDAADKVYLKQAKKLAKYMSQTIENYSADEMKYQDANEEDKSPEAQILKIQKWLVSKKFSFGAGAKESSAFSNEDPSNSMDRKKLQRLKKEISILSSSLPDGIFVKVDEDHFDFMKVMIIGPEGTPYENGCFLFDLYLPQDFPESCPKMKFLTTGSGQFYFNPNLYKTGKVCLSLLGTWSGPSWDPETSTLLQLLVSLQGMVLVDYPLENEPGQEGKAQSEDSLSYNKGIRHATLEYAMNWAFTNETSYPVFAAESKLWLYAHKQKIEKQLQAWKEINEQDDNRFCQYFNWERFFKKGSFDRMTEEMLNHLKEIPDKSYE
jgi:ubiquitin-protein ligase